MIKEVEDRLHRLAGEEQTLSLYLDELKGKLSSLEREAERLAAKSGVEDHRTGDQPRRPTGDPDEPRGDKEEPPPAVEIRPPPRWDPEAVKAKEPTEDLPPEYVVEPPDMIRIEVLEALPARPIGGERLVRPDGRVSLDFYGEIYVAGLTPTEIKEKVVLHMRQFLTEEAIGLVELDGESMTWEMLHPRDTNRVFVEVTTYNSKVYYVQGDVAEPGRQHVTGGDSVLDAINYAGGLLPTADPRRIRLVRPAPEGGAEAATVLPVDLFAIVEQGDSATNYRLKPGDRIIVSRFRDPIAVDRRVEQLFLADANVQDLREALRDFDARLHKITQSVRNPRDPMLIHVQRERDRMMERYTQLWADLVPALRARLAEGDPDSIASEHQIGSPPPIEGAASESTTPETGAVEPEDGAGGPVVPSQSESLLRTMVEKLDAPVSREEPGMFTVSGEVGTPGRFVVAGEMTVSDALELTGGIGPTGRRVVSLLRPGEPIRKIAAGPENRPEREEDDVTIEPGDQLVVPREMMPAPVGLRANGLLVERHSLIFG